MRDEARVRESRNTELLVAQSQSRVGSFDSVFGSNRLDRIELVVAEGDGESST